MTREDLHQFLGERLAVLAADEWAQSRFHPDLIGRDTRALVHKSWAIGIGGTQAHDAAKVEDGAHSNTRVRVRWVHLLRPNGEGGQVEDYRAALRSEQALIVAACKETIRGELSLWLDDIEEPKVLTGDDNSYVAGTVWFLTGHILELA